MIKTFKVNVVHAVPWISRKRVLENDERSIMETKLFSF